MCMRSIGEKNRQWSYLKSFEEIHCVTMVLDFS